MALYRNHSGRTAIVTINVQSTDAPKKSLQKGVGDAIVDLDADVGFHDVIVESGQALSLGNNTSATLVSVRNAD